MNTEASALPYGREFYLGQQDGSLRSAAVIVPHLLEAFAPRSAVDVGCGVATWLSVLNRAGVPDVVGMDGDYVDRSMLKIPGERFVPTDLRRPPPVSRSFDLALCLEVAEHLPEANAEGLVRHLTSLAPVVVFSAAVPGQGGTDHINEQWQDYWRSRFAAQGFAAYDLIRPLIWTDERVEFWYRQNVVCYIREGDPAASGLVPVADEVSLNFVHPALFRLARQEGEMFLSKALRMIPRLALNAVRRRLPAHLAPGGEAAGRQPG